MAQRFFVHQGPRVSDKDGRSRLSQDLHAEAGRAAPARRGHGRHRDRQRRLGGTGRITFREYAEDWRKAQVHRPSSAAKVESVLLESGFRTAPTEHCILHEVAHVVVGEWPNVINGRYVFSPDHHGALFTRRHLDLVAQFHPDCAPDMVDAYVDCRVEVAPPDIEPASWWNLPRPTEAEIKALARNLSGTREGSGGESVGQTGVGWGAGR